VSALTVVVYGPEPVELADAVTVSEPLPDSSTIVEPFGMYLSVTMLVAELAAAEVSEGREL
jgi:hypothetical protein